MAEQDLAPMPMAAPQANRWPVTVKQLFLIVGLAAAVASAIAVILWSQSPGYTAVQPGMSDRDAAEVVAVLQSGGVPFKLDSGSGSVMVPGDKLREVKLMLAEAGLPRGAGPSMSDFGGQGFGQTPFMENALYLQAQQTELARTIMELRPVKGARVHLAVPPRSAFVRNRQTATASVMVELFPGRTLDAAKVDAIAHLVAASVPQLEPEQVAVVDQTGTLLSRGMDDSLDAITNGQFDMKKQYELAAARAIEDQLEPVLGAGRVRATVHAQMDFTKTYETAKTYDPNSRVAVSETQQQESRRGDLAGQGVPGALTNQPPETADAQQAAGPPESTISNSSSSSRNFEVDETYREVNRPAGTVERLSIAVLVDNKAAQSGGDSQPLTDDELNGLTELAKQAVGFDEVRGDTISVINSAFQPPPTMKPMDPPPIWEQPWVWSIARQVLGVVLVLVLALFVVKPIVSGLTKAEPAPMILPGGEFNAGAMGEPGQPGVRVPAVPASYEDRLAATQGLIGQDPQQVAQVMRSWVAEQNG